MKRFFTIILIAITMIFCGCASEKNTGDLVFGSAMKVNYTLSVSDMQMDSICNVDELPNYRTWLGTKFTDYETNTVYFKRIYFKSYSDDYEMIYILLGEKEPYKITRRIAE